MVANLTGWKAVGLVVMVLAAIWPAVLDGWDDLHELFSQTQHCDMEQKDAPASFQFLSMYRNVFDLTRARPATDRVRLIALDQDLPELQANPCLGRAFTADVLATLASRRPGAVALDRYYPPHSCDHFPQGTQSLMQTAATFPEPLIIGAKAEPSDTDDPYSCQCESVSLELTGPQVRRGYIDLNEDLLEAPLRWVLLRQGAPKGQYIPPDQSYGLAFATAIAMQPQLQKQLAAMTTEAGRNEQPYVDLWHADEPQGQSATDFLCAAGDAAVKERWKLQCKPGTSALDVEGKAVVLGSVSAGDDKLVLGDSMPGYKLQARYIAALLGGAYLREWMLVVRLGAAFVLIVITELLVLSATDLHAHLKLPSSWEPRVKHRAILGSVLRWVERRTVMGMVSLLCGGVLLVSMASLAIHFLPPFGLMATAALTLLGDFRFWAKEEAKRREERQVAA